MINELFADVKDRMVKAVGHYSDEVAGIRTGRASINMLDSVKADYYGTPTPIRNMANVTVPEPQMIIIQAFDPTGLKAIEKAIRNSDLGLNPNNDGHVIRLNIPTLTDERRQQLIKVVHNLIEEGRVAIRNIRRDANDQLKKANNEHILSDDNLKRALDDVQEMTDKYIKELNEVQTRKETEIKE